MKKSIHIPVFYEGQDDLVDVLSTSMTSVCYNTEAFIDFYIMDCGISELNKKLLWKITEKFNNCSIEFIHIDISQFKDLKGYRGGNFTDCYSRLLIPELKPNLNKALFLDTDTIAIKDILEVWQQDLDNYEIAGVPDVYYGNHEFIKQAQISPHHKFFNAGLLIFDCEKWREKNRTKQCFQIAKKYKKYLAAMIEDILNVVYNDNNYKYLPLRYCYSELPNASNKLGKGATIEQDLLEERKKAIIVHFSGENKPWLRKNRQYPVDYIKSGNNTLYHFKTFWFFAEMTPFFNVLRTQFLHDSLEHIILQKNKKSTLKIKLFGLFTLITIKTNGENRWAKLFGFIPILKVKNKPQKNN